jgi:hypothetical protein
MDKRKLSVAFVKGNDEVSSSEPEDDEDDEPETDLAVHNGKMKLFSNSVDDYSKTADERFSNLAGLNKIVNKLMRK